MLILGLQPHFILGVGLQSKEDVAAKLPVGVSSRVADRERVKGMGDPSNTGAGTMDMDVRKHNVVPPAPGVIATVTGILEQR